MAWIGPVLSVLGTGWQAYQQYEDRRAAKKAEKENRRRSAWNALMQAAAGGVPSDDYQEQAIPGVNWGGVLSAAGNAVSAYQQNKQATVDKAKLQEIQAAREQRAIDQDAAQRENWQSEQAARAAALDMKREQMKADAAAQAAANREARADKLRRYTLDLQQQANAAQRNQIEWIKGVMGARRGGGGRQYVGAEEAGVPPMVRDESGAVGTWDGYIQDYKWRLPAAPSQERVGPNGFERTSGGTDTSRLPIRRRRGAADDDPLNLLQ